MNNELTLLYKEKMEGLALKLNDFTNKNQSDIKPTNPLLIHLLDEEKYKKSDIKVMIFGQETFDWEGNFGSKDIDQLLQTYDNFFWQGECYKYGGSFWNTINDLKKSLEDKYPNKEISFIWNNLLKIGREGEKGKPTEEIINITKNNFQVIRNEIEILKPDVVIFFTGPNYDVYINSIFEDSNFMQINDWDVRYIAKIQANFLPTNTFRTYHPRYLKCPKHLQEKYPNFYSDIKETILSLI